MPSQDNYKENKHEPELLQKISDLETKLAEAEDTIRAIRDGEVDAVVVNGTRGEQIYSLIGNDSIYRLIVETMKEAAFTVSFDGTILFCNAQFGLFVNSPIEKITGHKLADFISIKDRPAVNHLLSHAEYETVKQRLVFHGTDGTELPAHISASVLNQPDGSSICVVANDLSELEKSTELIQELKRRQDALSENEALLRDVINTIADAVYVKDTESRLILANPATASIVGKPLEQIIGHTDAEIYEDPSTGEKIMENDRLIFQSGIVQTVEETVEKHDGKHVYQSTKIPRRDSSGKIIGLVGVSRDITKMKQTEEAIRKTNDELEHRVAERTAELKKHTEQLRTMAFELTQTESRERKRLAGILHDNLQQLLAGAKMRIQLLQRKTKDKVIIESAQRVTEILDDSIKVSRSLTAELSPPILHEKGLLSAVRWLARWMDEMHGLTVEVVSDARDHVYEEGFSLLIFQSVRELLFNITKHAGVINATIAVNTKNDRLEVVIADKGTGFDTAKFEANRPKTGLGLFTIMERVDLLGGTVKIDSSPNKGTSITLTVPLPHTIISEKNITSRQAKSLITKTINKEKLNEQRKIRVLIADDHKIVQEGLANLINGESDMEMVGMADDGIEAVEMARRLLPDVIIMDINMPRMSGLDATKKIVSERPETRVICLSMYEKTDREESMRNAGAVAYLTKDGPPNDLIKTVRENAAS